MTESERLGKALDDAYLAYSNCKCVACDAWLKWDRSTPRPRPTLKGCKSAAAYMVAEDEWTSFRVGEMTPEHKAKADALAAWTACECDDCKRFMAGPQQFAAGRPVPKTCALWRAYDEAETAWNRSIEIR